MTKRTRRKHSAVFKAKVALEALAGDKTLAMGMSEYIEKPMTISVLIKSVRQTLDMRG